MRRALALALLAPLLLLAACGDDGDDVDAGGSEPGATEPAPADDLAGRTFLATEVTEDGAPRPLVDGTELRLSFADGQVGVQAGCNQLSGAYRLDGDVLTVEALGGTEMGCDPDRMDQDAWIAEVLAQPLTVALDGDTLTLSGGGTVIRLTDREVAAPDAELVGPTWTLDTLISGTEASGTASTPPAGVTATIAFAADGTYQVSTGCNTGSGTWSGEGAALEVDPPALTRRACTGLGAEVEAAMVAVLTGPVTAEVTEQRLTLTRDTQSLGFTAG